MCMSSRTQAITNPLGHLLINNKKTYHRCVCHQEHKLSLIQLGHLLINNKKTYHRCVCHQARTQAITNPARAPVNK